MKYRNHIFFTVPNVDQLQRVVKRLYSSEYCDAWKNKLLLWLLLLRLLAVITTLYASCCIAVKIHVHHLNIQPCMCCVIFTQFLNENPSLNVEKCLYSLCLLSFLRFLLCCWFCFEISMNYSNGFESRIIEKRRQYGSESQKVLFSLFITYFMCHDVFIYI